MDILMLIIGGSLGTVKRYLLVNYIMGRSANAYIPPAVLLVNLIGSCGLGLFLGLCYVGLPALYPQDSVFLLLGVGFFGAFTTFSTFSMESIMLFRQKKYTKTIIYIASSTGGSILFFGIGFTLGFYLNISGFG